MFQRGLSNGLMPDPYPLRPGGSKVRLLFLGSVANFRHNSAYLLFGGAIVLWCSRSALLPSFTLIVFLHILLRPCVEMQNNVYYIQETTCQINLFK